MVRQTVKQKIRSRLASDFLLASARFELNGKNLIHFAGWKNHVSMYPTPEGTDAFNKAISKYAGGKGTTKFPLDEPLPLKLIRQIVKYRVADNLKNEKSK